MHVARATELICAQRELIRKLDQRGVDTRQARILLHGMCKSLALMMEHRDRLEHHSGGDEESRKNNSVGPRKPR
jgi:hypothetical protein